MIPDYVAEAIAATILDRDGIAGIWRKRLAAATARRKGDPQAAAMLTDIADAAEREWARRHLHWSGEGDLINRPQRR